MANVWGESIKINELPDGAQVIAWGHRSGANTHQLCPRQYFFNYEYLGHGISRYPTPLHFNVGSAVHLGLAALLLEDGIDSAVQQALDYMRGGRVFETLSEDVQIEQLVLVEGLLYAFYVYAYPTMMRDFEVLCVETGAVEYIPIPMSTPERCDASVPCNGYGYTCQLPSGHMGECDWHTPPTVPQDYIAIQSRPDAILRNRATHEVCGISWKTIDDPSDFRRSQLVNDLQGFMELYYGEKILEKLAGTPVTIEEIKRELDKVFNETESISNVSPLRLIQTLQADLAALEHQARAARNIPTTIDYIQTIFLIKGKRVLTTQDDLGFALSQSLAGNYSEYEQWAPQPDKQFRQMSHLCYRYRNPNVEIATAEFYKSGPNKGRPKPLNVCDPNYFDESWAYRFFKPGNETGSSLSNKWLTSQIQQDQIRNWIDRLNAGEIYPSNLSDERNPHPLAKIIRFEEPLYRDGVRAASHVRQQQNRFVQIARAKQELQALTSEFGWVSDVKLDELFPQQLISCRTPYRCTYHQFCHGPESTQIDFQTIPEGFELRQAHHAPEREYIEAHGVVEDD
jgi:hypothetical protein